MIGNMLSTVLVNHYPVVREPTDALWYPEFAQWCDTAHWHQRYHAAQVIYGHQHIPRTTRLRFQEVSLGYPRERHEHGLPDNPLRPALPAAS